jgi:pimeloyl-ACP methyl ester carboxylesterase
MACYSKTKAIGRQTTGCKVLGCASHFATTHCRSRPRSVGRRIELESRHHRSAEQALLAAVQRPIAAPCIQQAVPRPGWKDLPSWFLVAEEDRMINPATQKFMAERMQARTRTDKHDHAPLITQSQAVVDILTEAVESVMASGG